MARTEAVRLRAPPSAVGVASVGVSSEASSVSTRGSRLRLRFCRLSAGLGGADRPSSSASLSVSTFSGDAGGRSVVESFGRQMFFSNVKSPHFLHGRSARGQAESTNAWSSARGTNPGQDDDPYNSLIIAYSVKGPGKDSAFVAS